jgi:hypothetical protein
MRVFVSIVLVPLLLLFFFNRVANWHYHILPNGLVIEHSHPYSSSTNSKSPYQNHSHTDFEIIVLSIITTLSGFLLVLFFLSKGTVKQIRPLLSAISNQQIFSDSPFSQSYPRRGPPFLTIC